MNLPTLLTEAALKGAERRAAFQQGMDNSPVRFFVIERTRKVIDTPYGPANVGDCITREFPSHADCTAFIEREGLRASMAWLAEKWDFSHDVNELTAWGIFKALAGGGEAL